MDKHKVYGFDVMLDDKMKPWLLEVNISPSLSSSSPLDKRIKTQLVADSLTLVGFRPFDYKMVEKEVNWCSLLESSFCSRQKKNVLITG